MMNLKANPDAGTADLGVEVVGLPWVNVLLNHAYGRTASQPIKDAIQRRIKAGQTWQQILAMILSIIVQILGGNAPAIPEVVNTIERGEPGAAQQS